MYIQRLLIADSSPFFAEELTRRLSGTFLIQSCTDGCTAKNLLESFQPHVVLVDAMISGLDGIGVIQSIISSGLKPKVLLTTNVMTPFLERFAQQRNVEYIVTKPCDPGALVSRICEIAGTPCRDIIMSEAADCTIVNMLSALNVCANHKGYAFLCYGIDQFRHTPGLSMTRELYPAIAKHFHTQSAAVEHDIRRAIDAAWRCGNRNTWRLYFPSGMEDIVPRPTNTVFISTLAYRLRLCQSRRA